MNSMWTQWILIPCWSLSFKLDIHHIIRFSHKCYGNFWWQQHTVFITVSQGSLAELGSHQTFHLFICAIWICNIIEKSMICWWSQYDFLQNITCSYIELRFYNIKSWNMTMAMFLSINKTNEMNAKLQNQSTWQTRWYEIRWKNFDWKLRVRIVPLCLSIR